MKAKNPTKDEIIEKLRRHKGELKLYGVKRIGLFGSFIRKEQKRKSNIDKLVKSHKTYKMSF